MSLRRTVVPPFLLFSEHSTSKRRPLLLRQPGLLQVSVLVLAHHPCPTMSSCFLDLVGRYDSCRCSRQLFDTILRVHFLSRKRLRRRPRRSLVQGGRYTECPVHRGTNPFVFFFVREWLSFMSRFWVCRQREDSRVYGQVVLKWFVLYFTLC